MGSSRQIITGMRFGAMLLSIALLWLIALPANAQVFKCVDAATGKLAYSDTPCKKGSTGGVERIQNNTIDSSGSREQALRRELQEMQRRMDSLENKRDQPTYGRTESDLQAERADSRECEQAKRSYDIEAGSMTRSRSTVAAKESAMRSACGMREPDRTTINVYTPYR